MRIIGVALIVLILGGCADHQKSLHSTKEREMTVGIVQKEIHTGMSQADVAQALGSPNIVTKDSEEKQTWIYDKIATEASYSTSAGGLAAQASVPALQAQLSFSAALAAAIPNHLELQLKLKRLLL